MKLADLIIYIEAHEITKLCLEYYFGDTFTVISGLGTIAREWPDATFRVDHDPVSPKVLNVYIA